MSVVIESALLHQASLLCHRSLLRGEAASTHPPRPTTKYHGGREALGMVSTLQG